MLAAFAMVAKALPSNATIIADPYEAYLCNNARTINLADPNVVVTTESSALHAILPVVNRQDKVKTILNPGYQIAAISEEVCNALALYYNSTIHFNMMLANSNIDQSLGLA